MNYLIIGLICFTESFAISIIITLIARKVREELDFKERKYFYAERSRMQYSEKYENAKEQKEKIGDILELTKPYVCDCVCKWPCECCSEEELKEICAKCQFEKNSEIIMKYVKK